MGEDNFDFFVSTLNHVEPVKFAVSITAESVDAVGESLKAFIRTDDSMEAMLSIEAQEDKLFATDQQLWKLALPIVRISHKLPSEELQFIPMIPVFSKLILA